MFVGWHLDCQRKEHHKLTINTSQLHTGKLICPATPRYSQYPNETYSAQDIIRNPFIEARSPHCFGTWALLQSRSWPLAPDPNTHHISGIHSIDQIGGRITAPQRAHSKSHRKTYTILKDREAPMLRRTWEGKAMDMCTSRA